jgi:hypothetical protein
LTILALALVSSITIVSDAPNCGVTYDRHYDNRISFLIQTTGQNLLIANSFYYLKSGWIWTLDLFTISWVFYHCATVAQPSYNKKLLSYFKKRQYSNPSSYPFMLIVLPLCCHNKTCPIVTNYYQRKSSKIWTLIFILSSLPANLLQTSYDHYNAFKANLKHCNIIL